MLVANILFTMRIDRIHLRSAGQPIFFQTFSADMD